ncbi:MAG: hypothetical protein LBJ21_01115 [Acidobacteriota bacterium]|jgi:hypothetical protein|nr:hypothetical protein [Acidobacteriota bacterium]
MIIKEPHLIKTATEEQFATWLTTKRSANGYARNLRTEPPKLDISLSLSERDVFRCRTTAEFDTLNSVFQAAPNFREVNRGANHGAFSAGLAAYRRYLQSFEWNGEVKMHEQVGVAISDTAIADKPQVISTEPQRVAAFGASCFQRYRYGVAGHL